MNRYQIKIMMHSSGFMIQKRAESTSFVEPALLQSFTYYDTVMKS
ncbi:hypothetical protein [Paenibacillus faecalis]|nr:hypothetical protein [Paenibacillus faecalis]